jgi:hypothetical protein
MGLFSNIGKAIKNVTKAISIDNVVKVATGRAKEVVQDVTSRAFNGLAGNTAMSAAAKAKAASVTPVVSTARPTVQGKPLVTARVNVTGNPIIDAAIGGAAVGAGTAIIGTDGGNSVVNATGWAAIKQWLSKNVALVIGGAAVLGVGVWYFFIRKKRATKGKGNLW